MIAAPGEDPLAGVVHELLELLLEKAVALTSVSATDVATVYERWGVEGRERAAVAEGVFRFIARSDPDQDAEALERWRIVLQAGVVPP